MALALDLLLIAMMIYYVELTSYPCSYPLTIIIAEKLRVWLRQVLMLQLATLSQLILVSFNFIDCVIY